jgi:hypothetical protein
MAERRKLDDGEGKRIPPHLRELINDIGIVVPDEPEDIHDLAVRVCEDAECMTCHGELRHETMILIDKHGIRAAYCQGACSQDMQIIGWLQQEHDDLVQRIEFRGGRGGN